MLCIIKNRDIIGIFCSLILYVINNTFLKTHTTGILNIFFVCYFNDCLAMIFMLACSNVLLRIYNIRIIRLHETLLFAIACGMIWEFFAPVINSTSITDYFDFLAYISGAIIYTLFIKLNGMEGR